MTHEAEAAYKRIRDILMNEYIMSSNRVGTRFDSLVLRTHKQFVLEYGELEVQEKKEEYAKTRCAEKKATAKK